MNGLTLNILMVDDRPENLAALEAVLDSPSVSLTKCLSGEEALKAVLRQEFALILMDVQMPGMDGYETARLIKSREKNRETPIIFVTAINKEPEHVHSGYSIGAIDYLFKPYDPDILRAKVQSLIQLYLTSKAFEQQALQLKDKTNALEQANDELIRMTSELQRAEAFTRAISEALSDTVVIFDEQGQIIRINPAAVTMFGYQLDELPGRYVGCLFEGGIPDFAEFIRVPERSTKRIDIPALRKDGSKFPSEVQIQRHPIEGQAIFVCSVHDITNRVEQLEAMRYIATHDDLTELPNRALLYERLDALIAGNQRFSLLLLDLDHFKAVNDTLGHHLGDQLLLQIGNLIRSVLSAEDTVFRLGGDEFAVLLPHGRESGATLEQVNAIMAAIDQPVELDVITLSVSASLGVVFHPDHGTDAQTLLRRADVAMYEAKRTMTGSFVYTKEQDQNDPYRLMLMGDLRKAAASGELRLVYQPKANVRTREIEGVEALLRWQHPKFGMIPPDHFIPIAEQIGVIHSITEWVLEQAVRQCRSWMDDRLPIGIAINLSVRNLQDAELPDKIHELLERYDVPPGSITLEITESFIMADPIRAKETLMKIHNIGIRLSIDDFGTGYSSLGYLKNLPVSSIKIDKSFIKDMVNSHADAMIVRSVINLAANLGMEVIAEGVEDEVSWQLLDDYGCDVVQGFYVQKPLPEHELIRWYESWNASRRGKAHGEASQR